MTKTERYLRIHRSTEGLLADETDEIAVMATVAGLLFHELETVDWAGFYRVVASGLLKLGPFQGEHGCLTIPFERGVCGKCARENRTQIIADVRTVQHHIACSASTRSEIVVPVRDCTGAVRAVLDLDSNQPGAFSSFDGCHLSQLTRSLTALFALPGPQKTSK